MRHIAKYYGLLCLLSLALSTTIAVARENTTVRAPLNSAIVQFCLDNHGRRVGNGQCAELALRALQSVHANVGYADYPAHEDYVWGDLVCSLEIKAGRQILGIGRMGGGTGGRRTDVRPGDIIQFRNAVFSGRRGNTHYRMTMLHHTSVISEVAPDGLECTVLEENAGGKLYVTTGHLYIPDLSSGWLRVYRPVPANRH